MSQTTLTDNPRRSTYTHRRVAEALPKLSTSRTTSEGVSIAEPEQKFPTLPLALPEHCPKPDPQGITETIELYKSELGREITREEADIILSRTIRFVWAINLHRNETPTSTHLHKQQ